jgi:hypothetical protein
MKPRVYLAGAIAGLNYGDATDWRHQAKFLLAERGIETLNPMRAKNVLGERNGGTIGNSYHDYEKLGWAYALQIPAVVAIEETGNPHDNHPMLHETMRFRVATLEEAIEAVAIVVNR